MRFSALLSSTYSYNALPFLIIDGSWIDIGSVICGFLYIPYRRKCIKSIPKMKLYPIRSRKTGIDFANGVSLFPLLVLIFSVVSSDIMKSITHSSGITMAVAGVCGALAILEE